ncbi:MAG: hypothetical protein U0Y82_07235 [Thermoleophilia bacterium]
MRVGLRAPFIGDGATAAGARALRDALTRAGVDVMCEPRDPGGPVTAADAPHGPCRALPVNAHLQWCDARDVDPNVVAPVRAARVSGVAEVTPAHMGPLRAMDLVWVASDEDRSRLIGLGLRPERVLLCAEPVRRPALPDAPPAGVHGRVILAIAPPPDAVRTLVGVWAWAVAPDADATLVIAGDDATRTGVLATLDREDVDETEMADLMVLDRPLTDAQRLALIERAHLVVSSCPRITAEAAAVGVPWADLVHDPAALAAACVDTSERLRMPGDLRHDADAVAADMLAALTDAGDGGRTRRSPGRPRVRLHVPARGRAGAEGARGLAEALLAQGRTDVVVDADDARPASRALRWAAEHVHGDPVHVTVRAGSPADIAPVVHGALVAMADPDAHGGHQEWCALLHRYLDELWVPSERARRTMLHAGADPARVAVVPAGYDAAHFHLGLGAGAAPGLRMLLAGGGWEDGADLALHAFAEAFAPADGVVLLVPRSQGHPVPEIPGVEAVDVPAEPGARAALLATCHCLVHPHRTLTDPTGLLEAMGAGLPVIVPHGGPVDDLLDEQTALRVGTTAAGEVDVQALSAAMRWVLTHRDEAAVVGPACRGPGRVRAHAGRRGPGGHLRLRGLADAARRRARVAA